MVTHVYSDANLFPILLKLVKQTFPDFLGCLDLGYRPASQSCVRS
jgi:hypothetical protein